MPSPVCRFEYCYRDASNYKGYGSVLLWGEVTPETEATIRAALIDRMYFEAERVGVPSLYHLVRGDSEADDEEDHGWHEFGGLVAAGESGGDPAALMLLDELIRRLRSMGDQ